jgi:CRISPR/Cas system-associated protein Cas10 (large subunit of type III CRISPR-Cas system)
MKIFDEIFAQFEEVDNMQRMMSISFARKINKNMEGRVKRVSVKA